MVPSLAGHRIVLRSIDGADASAIARYAADVEISRWTEIPHPYTMAHAREFIDFSVQENRNGKSAHFGIEWIGSGEIIGMCSLTNIDRDARSGEIGYWLAKDYWGKGIASDSVEMIMRHGFLTLRMTRLYARVIAPNEKSLRLLDRLGFVDEGTLREAFWRNGRAYDVRMFSMLVGEYAS